MFLAKVVSEFGIWCVSSIGDIYPMWMSKGAVLNTSVQKPVLCFRFYLARNIGKLSPQNSWKSFAFFSSGKFLHEGCPPLASRSWPFAWALGCSWALRANIVRGAPLAMSTGEGTVWNLAELTNYIQLRFQIPLVCSLQLVEADGTYV